MKYWCAKYALTEGIIEGDCEPEADSYGYFYANNTRLYCKAGRDIFDSKDEAISNAKAMQKAKISSLKKQIARVEGLVFE